MRTLKKKNTLITGLPGTGKTTLIRKIAGALKSSNPSGFYTAEIREGSIRKGFELVSLTGERRLLSHTNIDSRHRVGKYRIDLDGFATFLDTIDFENPSAGPIIIDEIGKMECFSTKFIGLVENLLDSDKPVVAVVAMKGGGFPQKVKARHDIVLFELTRKNGDTIFEEILSLIQK